MNELFVIDTGNKNIVKSRADRRLTSENYTEKQILEILHNLSIINKKKVMRVS